MVAKAKRSAPAKRPPDKEQSDALIERIIKASMACGWSIPRTSADDRSALMANLELSARMMEQLATLAARCALMATRGE